MDTNGRYCKLELEIELSKSTCNLESTCNSAVGTVAVGTVAVTC